jgi:predicted nucleic acid-binding protein
MIQAAVRDTLLRLSEQRIFLCRWSEEILEEVRRNLIVRRKLPEEKVDWLLGQLRDHFPDACVESGYKELIPAIRNDHKDRHVIAAAVYCKAEVILTYNIKHFPEESVRPFNICVKHRTNTCWISTHWLLNKLCMSCTSKGRI